MPVPPSSFWFLMEALMNRNLKLACLIPRKLFLISLQPRGCLQNFRVLRPNFVIRIGINPSDHPPRFHQKHTGYRKLVVLVTGRGLKVDAVFLEHLQPVIFYLKRNSKGSGCRHFGIGIKRVTEPLGLQTLLQQLGPIRANCNDGKA